MLKLQLKPLQRKRNAKQTIYLPCIGVGLGWGGGWGGGGGGGGVLELQRSSDHQITWLTSSLQPTVKNIPELSWTEMWNEIHRKIKAMIVAAWPWWAGCILHLVDINITSHLFFIFFVKL